MGRGFGGGGIGPGFKIVEERKTVRFPKGEFITEQKPKVSPTPREIGRAGRMIQIGGRVEKLEKEE